MSSDRTFQNRVCILAVEHNDDGTGTRIVYDEKSGKELSRETVELPPALDEKPTELEELKSHVDALREKLVERQVITRKDADDTKLELAAVDDGAIKVR